MKTIALFLLSALAVWAAGLDGKWNAKVPMRDGPVDVTFELKEDGGKVSGRVSSSQGDAELVDGKLEGDALMFAIPTNAARYTLQGKVDGNQIRFSAKREGSDNVMEFTAKKAE